MKNLQLALLETVGKQISNLGFVGKPADQSFVRNFPGGRASLHLAFIKHPEDFDVVADVAVRFDALEDMINSESKILSNKEKSKTYSLGAELGNIEGSGQKRWHVTSAGDVAGVARGIVSDFERIGVPYIEGASDLARAYEMLTSPGRGAWLHSPIHSARAKRIVGLAKLLDREDDINRHIEDSISFMESIKDGGLQDFKRFAKKFTA